MKKDYLAEVKPSPAENVHTRAAPEVLFNLCFFCVFFIFLPFLHYFFFCVAFSVLLHSPLPWSGHHNQDGVGRSSPTFIGFPGHPGGRHMVISGCFGVLFFLANFIIWPFLPFLTTVYHLFASPFWHFQPFHCGFIFGRINSAILSILWNNVVSQKHRI